jgi:hypothetical protein
MNLVTEQVKVYLPPTGRLTIKLDWADELNSVPRSDETLVAVVWTLPTGLTNSAQERTDTEANLTIGTSNQAIGYSDFIICTATFSGGDIVSARVPFVIRHLDTTITDCY